MGAARDIGMLQICTDSGRPGLLLSGGRAALRFYRQQFLDGSTTARASLRDSKIYDAGSVVPRLGLTYVRRCLARAVAITTLKNN